MVRDVITRKAMCFPKPMQVLEVQTQDEALQADAGIFGMGGSVEGEGLKVLRASCEVERQIASENSDPG